MFIDKARIVVKGGSGGDGSASFRREKYVPKGGPDGGDGGRGGEVILEANPRLKTLLDFARQPLFSAPPGDNGRGRKCFGKSGEDLVLEVPCGTSVYREGELLADLLVEGQRVMVAKSGRGGRGNVHFKSSTRQTPRIAEKGEPGESAQLDLRLRIIADVGLIGFPNAGKSTLLSRLTRAHPKIANYPFTTLYPNLGVSLFNDREIVFADIPGLIEGSHAGKGLGHEFLQHIERTRVLVHVIDPLGYDGRGPRENIKVINNELKLYSALLAGKRQILVVNKGDLAEAKSVYSDIKKAFKKAAVLCVSGVSGDGIQKLLAQVAQVLDQIPADTVLPAEPPVNIRLEPELWVEQGAESFIVRGKRVERLVAMTNFSLPEAVQRTQYILKKMGVERALMAHGAEAGDMIRIGEMEFTFEPQAVVEGWPARRRRGKQKAAKP